MSRARWKEVDELFARAWDVAATEREALVATACGEDRELAAEVLSLLAHTTGASERLETVICAEAEELARARDPYAGRRLGAYKLGERLGEGGMGVVYAAARDDAVYRQGVAIKILKHGPGSAETAARFRDERQILASLEHPNIVRLLDGGSTDDGQPYLVMERVHGVPITRYATELALAAKLRLFRDVCAAVHHAHGQRVIHRDLKPSNILVDGSGTPKLLDFGIAKLLDDPDREARTRTGAAVLTPEYASPEQARGEPVTAASDVYSLGAVLYEMLAGKPPHTGDAIAILAKIIAVEPPPPSALASAPAQRRELVGDLDNIVMMALRKDAARRYASAAEVADDLGRHLAGLPVRARPPTLGYRLGKLMRRHRVAALALAIGVLATGGAIATVAATGSAHAPWQAAIEPVRWHELDDTGMFGALSPDASRIAFVSSVPGDERRLVVLDVHVGTHEVVDRDVWGAQRWSARGDALFYLKAGHAYRRPYPSGPVVDRGESTDDVTDCGDTLARLHENFSGQSIELLESDGAWRTLHKFHADEIVAFPRCDPDSGRILVVASPSWPALCAGHAAIVSRDGTTREVGAELCSATWGPGGRSLVYAARRSGRTNLFERMVDRDGSAGDEHALTTGAGPDMWPDVAGGGSAVAFAVDEGASLLAFEDATIDLRGGVDRLAVTRDGALIVAQVEDPFESRLEIASVARGQPQPHRIVEGVLEAISADDRRVYFRSLDVPDELRVVPIEGGSDALVARLPGRIVIAADGGDGVHVLLDHDGALEGWHVPAAGAPEPDGVAGLVLTAPSGGWRAIQLPADGTWRLRLVPPGGDPSRGTERDTSAYRSTWIDDHRLATVMPCGGAAECPAVLDARDGSWTPLPGSVPPDTLFVVTAGDGLHWVRAANAGAGQIQRQLITNFATRPWRP
jgi:hypothetical protein